MGYSKLSAASAATVAVLGSFMLQQSPARADSSVPMHDLVVVNESTPPAAQSRPAAYHGYGGYGGYRGGYGGYGGYWGYGGYGGYGGYWGYGGYGGYGRYGGYWGYHGARAHGFSPHGQRLPGPRAK